MKKIYKYILVMIVLAVLDVHVLIFSSDRYVNKSFGYGKDDFINPLRLKIINIFQLDVEKADKYGNNALFYAIYYGNDSGVVTLISTYSCEALTKTKVRVEAELQQKNAPQELIDAIKGKCLIP